MKTSGDPVIARDRVIEDDINIHHALEIGYAAGSCYPERSRVERSEIRESRRGPAMPVPGSAASGSSYEAADLSAETRRRGEEVGENLTTEARRHGERSGDQVIARDRVIEIIQTIKATLREIFDESAYDRFLLRTNASRSVASYRDFTRERDAAMLKKPRCC